VAAHEDALAAAGGELVSDPFAGEFALELSEREQDALDDRYDDGGYSGGTLERPALQRLIRDIEGGRVDTVVCYKIDRLSR
jgi:DNA invertase Pin-like site-specific DNA recombinase